MTGHNKPLDRWSRRRTDIDVEGILHVASQTVAYRGDTRMNSPTVTFPRTHCQEMCTKVLTVDRDKLSESNFMFQSFCISAFDSVIPLCERISQ